MKMKFLFKETNFISQYTLKAREKTDWHSYHLMINTTISLMFCAQCNLYLMNHQANCSSYTQLRFQLCEYKAKLHQKLFTLLKDYCTKFL